jgi:hypothetical protein
MNFIFILLIFCLVLFFYLHIYFQLKTSNDLEIYDIDNPAKDHLEEICDLRQPVVFLNTNTKNLDQLLSSLTQPKLLAAYSTFDVKVRNVKDNVAELNNESEMYIPISLANAFKSVKENTGTKYLGENNSDFLEESGLMKLYAANDAYLKPYMTCKCIYDYIFAGKGTQTPFRYEINYRNYFTVIEGEVKVKMTPPKSAKYLKPMKDYEYLEFRSPIDPWNIKEEDKPDFEKIKCLEIILKKGQLLYLPAYWWYSLEFSENTALASFKYRTYMNTLAILDKLFLNFLQSQNIKRKNMKTINSI